MSQKYLATKKRNWSSELFENCKTFDAGILISYFSLLFEKQLKMQKNKKKKTKESVTPYYTSGIKCDTNLEASGSGEFIGTPKDHI